ncbi:MAG: hypothetical protein V1911_00225, partial [Candidatus Micrarchaeota archaeon]
DPTWDSKIRHSKIVTGEWDGLNDTEIAMPLIKTFSFEESAKMWQDELNMTKEQWSEYFTKNGEFFRALNKWLNEQRKW